MKNILILIAFIPALAFSQGYKKHTLQKDKLLITLTEGVLNITPLTDKAIRIQ